MKNQYISWQWLYMRRMHIAHGAIIGSGSRFCFGPGPNCTSAWLELETVVSLSLYSKRPKCSRWVYEWSSTSNRPPLETFACQPRGTSRRRDCEPKLLSIARG